MALTLYVEKVSGDNPQDQIEHKLGSKDVFVQVWQNDYVINPSIAVTDKNKITVSVPNDTEYTVIVIGEKSSDTTKAKPVRKQRTKK